MLLEAGTLKTLFLFDLDFSKESASGGGESTGLSLIRVVHDTVGLESTAVCGLISHKISKDEEYPEWINHANKEGLDQDRFIIISKLRISEDDLEGFAWMLKLTLLNKPCKELRDQASAILKTAMEQAREEINGVRVYEFEHMVLRSSAQEGVWEPDTLFRLFGIFSRKAAHEKLHDDPQIKETVSLLRKISQIDIVANEHDRTDAWKIRQEELYESEERLNKYRVPIDSGDVFQKTGKQAQAQFILVAQPCDLMVREKGERTRKLNQVFLVRIKSIPAEKHLSEKDPTLSGKVLALPYFDKDDGKTWYIDFPDAHVANLLALDMCGFRPDGLASIAIRDACPEDLIPPWKLRFGKIQEEVHQILDSFSDLQGKGVAPDVACDLVIPPATYGDHEQFSRRVNPAVDGVIYGVRRVRRVCQPYATLVLQRFMNHLARAGLEHDFAGN